MEGQVSGKQALGRVSSSSTKFWFDGIGVCHGYAYVVCRECLLKISPIKENSFLYHTLYSTNDLHI